MMVMPSNHSSALIHYLAGKHPSRIGWLIGPTGLAKTKLRDWMPFACDNDAFSAWANEKEWDYLAWINMLKKITSLRQSPRWVLVPDVVAEREKTILAWEKYAPEASTFGFPLAFAVQDGMTPKDVPIKADVVFVGGTTEWKWNNLRLWTDNFIRVHVGRVNSLNKLRLCERLNVESVDGTGWFRDGDGGQSQRELRHWFENEIDPQIEINFQYKL